MTFHSSSFPWWSRQGFSRAELLPPGARRRSRPRRTSSLDPQSVEVVRASGSNKSVVDFLMASGLNPLAMIWWTIPAIILAGAIGGLANALLVDDGFKSGFKETLSNGQKIWRPGWIGNVFIGSVAGFMMWVLYGNLNLAEGQEILKACVGSLIAGIGGGRIITGEVDRRLLSASKNNLTDALKAKRKT